MRTLLHPPHLHWAARVVHVSCARRSSSPAGLHALFLRGCERSLGEDNGQDPLSSHTGSPPTVTGPLQKRWAFTESSDGVQ